MQESKLKVAVISAGMISNAAHIPAYKSIPDLVDVAAVCDLNPVSSEATAKRHGIPHWYTDAEEMLIKEQPDLVSVCTPNMAHKPMVPARAPARLQRRLRKAAGADLCGHEGDVRTMPRPSARRSLPAKRCAITTSTSSRASSSTTAIWETCTIRNSPLSAGAACPSGAPSIRRKPRRRRVLRPWRAPGGRGALGHGRQAVFVHRRRQRGLFEPA